MCLRRRARGSWWNKRWIEETVDATLDRLGPDHLPGFYRRIMSKGLEIKGFAGIFAGQKALQDIAGWMKEGKIAFPESIVEGIEAAPEALASVFAGHNHVGKLLVKASAEA